MNVLMCLSIWEFDIELIIHSAGLKLVEISVN